MKKYLFLFTIGPVQSFIEQARKTGDLFSGSMILSDIIKKTIEKLKSEISCVRLIYPAPDSPSMPNQFLAIIETENPGEIGKILEDSVLSEVKSLLDKSLEKLTIHNQSVKFSTALQNQMNNFIKTHWVAIPYEEENFKKQYGEIQKVLRGVKNLNSFNQSIQNPGKKCNLCGERNSLFYHWESKKKGGNSRNPFKLNMDNDGAIPIGNGQNLRIAQGEGLCAVCFTKRYRHDESFPSTAKIAIADSLDRMTEKHLLKEYRDIFKSYFDEQLLYEENLTEDYFKKNNLESSIDRLKDIKQKQRDISKSLKAENLKLTKYYALIKLDGDNMGKWLSGAYFDDQVTSEDLINFDMEFSLKLSEYAKTIGNYFRKSGSMGKLIYAGGDDVLAFVNLNHLTKVLKFVREGFPNFSEIKIIERNVIKDNKSSTASCGVVIAHYKTPLSEVLKWARKMEHEAKKSPSDKDSCAIAVLKHSGEINKSVFKWNYSDNSVKLWTTDLIGEIIGALNGYLSGSCIKNIDQEFRLLIDEDGCFGDDSIVTSEIKRFIMRSNRDSVDKKETEQKRKDLAEKIIRYYQSSGKLGEFVSLLNIIRFIFREVSYAD